MTGTRKMEETAWCPGCGNFGILRAFEKAAWNIGLDRKKLVLVSGIGQAAKFPHYSDANVFNGLHGRALPAATGIKIANPELEVIVTSGDGDMYGEGGNHLISAIRRNIGVKAFVHNNGVYGLTKGQASPTAHAGFVTKAQPAGVMLNPFNPLAVAIAQDCSFVARSSAALTDHLADMMARAIGHRGFALVDILQPCSSFNHVNTFKWYAERVRELPEGYDPRDREKAFSASLKWDDEIYIGVLYENDRKCFEDLSPALAKRRGEG